MPASLRRRKWRLWNAAVNNEFQLLTENGYTIVRNVSVFIWKGIQNSHERPVEGAEKSLPKRRRKRGLRAGKSRSRGRHPRRTSLSPATSSNHIERAIKHKLRMLDWNKSLSNRFSSAVRSYHEAGTFRPDVLPRVGYAKLERRWCRLHDIMAKRGGSDSKLNADSALGHSFISFLEDYVKVRVRPVKGESTSADSFAALLSRANLPKEPYGTRGKRPSGTLESGSWAGTSRGSPSRIMCRGCGTQFIVRGETCAVCYAKLHGPGSVPGRSGGATPNTKRNAFR